MRCFVNQNYSASTVGRQIVGRLNVLNDTLQSGVFSLQRNTRKKEDEGHYQRVCDPEWRNRQTESHSEPFGDKRKDRLGSRESYVIHTYILEKIRQIEALGLL
jgi:hypothetical protein